jgi:predicted DsbA family dithiol-disulfide isomerase
MRAPRVKDDGMSAGTEKPEALHWFDFICPFCYVSQDRDEILIDAGFDVVELPFQAHPEIPERGIAVGPRRGPMYGKLERQAREAGLPLNWPSRLPNSRTALAVSAWVQRHHPVIARRFNSKLFNAHFALGEDLGDAALVVRYADELGADVRALLIALADGSALQEVSDAEKSARGYGVRGTPAWLVRGNLIEGAVPLTKFRQLLESRR